jgi:general L-amino acid transport system permease protein
VGDLRAAQELPRGSGQKLQSALIQVAALAVLFLACFFIYRTTAANLARQGMASGFDFLWRRSGFAITPHLVPFDPEATFARALLVGLLNTLLLSAIAIGVSTVVGFLIGLARLSSNWLARILALAYVETFRNVPLLLQIFFWYFGVLRTLPGPRDSIALFNTFFLNSRGLYVPVPTVRDAGWLATAAILVLLAIAAARYDARSGGPRYRPGAIIIGSVMLAIILIVGRSMSWEVPRLAGFNFVGGSALVPELIAIAAALSIYQAAFIAEAVRGAVLSVSKGQIEAARSLGLTERTILYRVVIPQAMRALLPPLITLHLSTLKNSSLGAAIGYPEFVSVFAGTTLSLVGQAVEIMSMTLMIYLLMGMIVAGSLNILDWRLRSRGGYERG